MTGTTINIKDAQSTLPTNTRRRQSITCNMKKKCMPVRWVTHTHRKAKLLSRCSDRMGAKIILACMLPPIIILLTPREWVGGERAERAVGRVCGFMCDRLYVDQQNATSLSFWALTDAWTKRTCPAAGDRRAALPRTRDVCESICAHAAHCTGRYDWVMAPDGIVWSAQLFDAPEFESGISGVKHGC